MSTLSLAALTKAAAVLGCNLASILAIDEVESAGAGFDRQGRVKILFEPHVFHRLTGGAFGATHPDLSYPDWKPKAPSYKRDQHQVLAQARALVPLPGQHKPDDVDAAAVMSCSWGRYQLMGEGFRACGFNTVAAFERAMLEDEGQHLAGFVSYIRAKPSAHKALLARNWSAFARAYNGPGYLKHGYHTRLDAAYQKHLVA